MFWFVLVNNIYVDCGSMHLQVMRPDSVAYTKYR